MERLTELPFSRIEELTSNTFFSYQFIDFINVDDRDEIIIALVPKETRRYYKMATHNTPAPKVDKYSIVNITLDEETYNDLNSECNLAKSLNDIFLSSLYKSRKCIPEQLLKLEKMMNECYNKMIEQASSIELYPENIGKYEDAFNDYIKKLKL